MAIGFWPLPFGFFAVEPNDQSGLLATTNECFEMWLLSSSSLLVRVSP
jgi:hypothetical protein